MKPFNLAEARIAERTYCQTHLNRRIRVIVALVALIVVVAAISYGCGLMITGRAARVTSELAMAEKRSASIKQRIASIKAELCQRKWQDQLAQGSSRWLSVLDTAVGCLPADIWLTRLETSPKDSTLSIEGRAVSFDSLSAFMSALREDSTFSDIRLGSVRVAKAGDLSYVEFVMPIKLKSSMSAPGSPTPAADSTTQAPRPMLLARCP